MLISIDWIKDFVKLPDLSAKELSSRFTLATAEVEGVEVIGECFEKIKVAKVIEIEKHPEADKLNLVKFEFGEGKVAQVVCGAANVKVGMKTPYAPVGTTLPIGFTLEPKKIRGIESTGMLCSEQELGYSEDSSGILEMDSNATVGMTLREYFDERSDIIFDIDNKSLTHRPDLWGHFGIAREFAAIFEKELSNPFSKNWETKLLKLQNKDSSPIKITVEESSAGVAYFGLSLSGIEVGESPSWMKRRLNAVDLRPINNIVDISNYVMTELGMPLHIFDRDKIEGDTVFIKELGKKETFTTLDEEKRALIETDTVICDKNNPLVIGGIMGGLNSGVTEKTKDIFIEVANWMPTRVRRTSTRLGLRTESSQRYEKSLDSKMCIRTMLRTLELVLKLCPQAKVIGKLEYDGNNLEKIPAIQIETSCSNIRSVLGTDVDDKKILSIFSALDFDVKQKGDSLTVGVPSYRATKDIEVEVDLIEEIGRVIGYDSIKPISLACDVKPMRLSPAQKTHRIIRDFLVYNAQSFEVMTYPMIGEALLKKAKWDVSSELKLLNALSQDSDRMRETMVPSILEACGVNCKHSSNFKLFEIGRTYQPDSKVFAKDVNQLVIAFYDRVSSPFIKLSNSVEGLLAKLGLSYDMNDASDKFENKLISHKWIGVHPYEYQSIRIMGKNAGVISSIHPLVCKSYKIKGSLSIAIIDLSFFESMVLKDKRKFKKLSKFPNSEFDCTVIVKNELPASNVLSALKKIKFSELQSVKIRDIYQLDSNQKTITLKAIFNDSEKTIGSDRLKAAEDTIVKALSDAGFPLKTN